MAHAEIVCLRDAGRVGSYRDTVLYSTLMPCCLYAGAVVQFGIPRVIVGESHTFDGARTFMERHGVEVVDQDDAACRDLLGSFVRDHPELWGDDIGTLD
jgi:cytosine deaminase